MADAAAAARARNAEVPPALERLENESKNDYKK
jgi:hypothetical protein